MSKSTEASITCLENFFEYTEDQTEETATHYIRVEDNILYYKLISEKEQELTKYLTEHWRNHIPIFICTIDRREKKPSGPFGYEINYSIVHSLETIREWNNTKKVYTSEDVVNELKKTFTISIDEKCNKNYYIYIGLNKRVKVDNDWFDFDKLPENQSKNSENE